MPQPSIIKKGKVSFEDGEEKKEPIEQEEEQLINLFCLKVLCIVMCRGTLKFKAETLFSLVISTKPV